MLKFKCDMLKKYIENNLNCVKNIEFMAHEA